jgi:hypothetical protein
VSTDLFALASGLDPRAVVGRVPPACRRPVDPAPLPARDGGDVVVESPGWVPRGDAVHFVPAFSSLAASDAAFRLEVSVRDGAGWCPWAAGAPVGPPTLAARVPAASEGLACDVDVYTAPAPVHAVRVRVRLAGDAAARVLAAPWLLTLSAWDRCPAPAVRAQPRAPVALAVPAASQMHAPPAIARRICSPTSVAMVVRYWGGAADPLDVAADAFDAALDRYGVWPAAIRAAARRGLLGYLLAFPDWASAAWCLERGLPVVASVRYATGELPGAAMTETDGHLVVLTGFEDGDVLVNDPAAPSVETVPRRVALEALERVWLARAAVGYVLFRSV